MADLTALEEQIRATFATVPAPPAWCLSNSREGTEPELLERDFRDKHDWRLLTPAFLDWAPDGFSSALSFFSDEAFRFYLPAYLLADLHGQLQSVDVLFHLTHGLDNGSKNQLVNPLRYGSRTWFDHACYKFSIFHEDQARAIAAFIEHRRDHATTDLERTQAQEALQNYWLARTMGRR
jgi:hypothetical protein